MDHIGLTQFQIHKRISINLAILFLSIFILLVHTSILGSVVINFYSKLNKIKFYKLLIIAFLIRLSWVIFSDIQQSSDFIAYDNMALEILDGKSIFSYISNSRNVGVSIFASVIYFLFGYNQLYVLISFSILSTIQIIFVYKILSIISKKEVAIFSSLLLCFYPEHIILNNLISSDVLFSTIICFSIYILTKYYSKRYSKSLLFGCFLVGLVIGLSHWVRSTAPIFVVSFVIFFVLNKSFSIKQRAIQISFFIIGFFTIISPIINYNFKTTNKFDINPIHGQLGHSLLIGTFLEGDGRIKTWQKSENFTFLDSTLTNYLNNKPEELYSDFDDAKLRRYISDKIYANISISRIFNNPLKFAKIVLKYKLSNLWGTVAGLGFSLDSSNFKNYKTTIWFLSELFHRLIIIFSIIIFF